ncbi:unnamed protein product [Gongylonema pulchrum]|uniref:NERD domain-containing protein n=1 Tax=Gongylonema pulchrum TaxID=637853 RepID=A0A183EDI7_9BILA|nr:unnamed protein product [Gongylonema pulchrum]
MEYIRSDEGILGKPDFHIIHHPSGLFFLGRSQRSYYWQKVISNFYLAQESKLELPAIVICPKNADAIDGNLIVRQIREAVPEIDDITASSVLQFAVAGYGFRNMESG